jgi:hypothetical protein
MEQKLDFCLREVGRQGYNEECERIGAGKALEIEAHSKTIY